MKLGAAAMAGPRNDQTERSGAPAARTAPTRASPSPALYLTAEYVHVDEGEGGPKATGAGHASRSSSDVHARGGYVQLALRAAGRRGPLRKLTVYGRYDRRHAWFEGFTPITVDRITGGAAPGSVGRADRQGRVSRSTASWRARPPSPTTCFTSSVVYSMVSDAAPRSSRLRSRRCWLAAAGGPASRAAPPPDGRGWLGEEMPLPLAVRTPQDLAFKAVAERQYLIFNLLAGGKLAWDARRLRDRRRRSGRRCCASAGSIPRSTR